MYAYGSFTNLGSWCTVSHAEQRRKALQSHTNGMGAFCAIMLLLITCVCLGIPSEPSDQRYLALFQKNWQEVKDTSEGTGLLTYR